ncbi:organic cation transporter protein-like [Sinocyclocheilus rhinocerous]|uniref:organic cation transporter protein-like n=1 Tax=Sinocyclocheilus rhinocerous TaxID=307959 RepID=UPI0007B9A100|nr:PREDICTED: organic cation transporter protein-like [Sinocyclocheilus rhinocerous]
MADRLGRLKSLLASLMLAVVFGVLVCVSPSPPVFITMRFCLAAASAGVYLTLYVTRKSNAHGTRVTNSSTECRDDVSLQKRPCLQ